MSTKFSFHGGIHPPENKRQSTGGPIQIAPVPGRLIVPLSQHIGAPSETVVAVGDKVLKGQVIAEAVGRISVSVHAPSSGVVEAIEPRPVPHMSGMTAPCVVIKTDGQEAWCAHQGLDDYKAISKQELIDFIRHHGISGMGGAGFPTDVKLHLGDDHIVNTLVLNAMECEPYITADDMLLREHADQVVKGIEIIAHLLKPHHIMIGIEDNKPQAIRALEQAVKNTSLHIDIVVVPTVYPSGGEKQLIKLLTGIEVPSGKIPADVGIVCQNVGTASAIYEAVYHGIPLISRIVTLTGDALGHPHNMRALIGTPLETLLQAAELNEQALYRLVIGGPMMGYTVDSQSIPMIKTTNCIIAATHDEMPPAPPANPCIRCGMCEQVCPAELLPQQLHWFAKGKEFEKAKHHNLFDCIECGACSYVCPSNIPLVQYYRFAKAEIRTEEAEQRKADHARQRFEARQARLEQEKVEKELRRKQRAEEAAKAQAVKKDKLASATTSATKTSGPAPTDLKALKTAAAVSRTKLKKAEKALADAEAKGLDGLEQLRSTVTELTTKAEAAQQAYDQAQSVPAPIVEIDIKQLKTNAAVARTKLKQAEKALAKAEESGEGDIPALQAQLAEQKAKTAAAQKAYDDAESGSTGDATASSNVVAELKQTMDAAAAKVDKARKALDGAIAANSPAVEKMRAGVEKLQGKYEEAKAEYEQASKATASTAVVNLDELKADLEAMQGKVDKAQKALDAAIASGSPAVEKMRAGVDKLQGKLTELQQAYEQAGGTQVTPTPEAVDPKALKQQVSIMRTKLKKAQNALDEASDDATRTELEAEVQRLSQLHDEAKNAFDAYENQLVARAAAEGVDLRQLKIDAAMARAEVTKAERALNKAREENPEELPDIEQQLLTAQHKAEQLNQTLSRFTD
jgi:electron transport complex protein RnfC